MRIMSLMCVVGLVVGLTGCSGGGDAKPVTATKELEAQQKKAEKEANDAEMARQKATK